MTDLDEELFGKTEHHESYGLLNFARAQTTPVNLFGSSIDHQNIVIMEITEASNRRALSNDWYTPGKVILRAVMSPSQFADAITSLNTGTGIPITLELVAGDPEDREPPPRQNVRETFESEASEKLGKTMEMLNQAIENATRVRDRKNLESIKQQLVNSIPFLETQFQKQMEKTVNEAKAEVEAFITAREQRSGPAALNREDQPYRPALTEQEERQGPGE